MIPSLLNLPTELFDSILNHLSDDKSSLRSCCLASRTFLPTAQALLFRCVMLYASPLRERLHLRAGTKLRHLVESSHLLSHTRELEICGMFMIDNERWLSYDTELLPALEAFISLKDNHNTVDCGHSLKCISLVQINWHMSSTNPLNATLQRLLALESVTHIMILFCDIPLNISEHFSSGVKLLELAHNIFQNSAAVKQVVDGHPKPVSLPAIRPESLIIREEAGSDKLARAIFNNPGRGCDSTSIRTLDVSGLKAHEFGTFVLFVPHVESLRIWSAREPYDLGQLPRLRCLYMQMRAYDTDPYIRWLAQSLRHLKTGNSFRSITLTYFSNKIHHNDILAYAELDSVLAGPQFEYESFSGMTIKMPKKLSSTDFYSLLPRTVDKKLLKVVNAL